MRLSLLVIAGFHRLELSALHFIGRAEAVVHPVLILIFLTNAKLNNLTT